MPKYKYKNVKCKMGSGEEVDIKIENENLAYHPRQTIIPENKVIKLFENLFPGFVRNVRKYKGELYFYTYSVSFGYSFDWFGNWDDTVDFRSFIMKTRILIEKKGLNWFDSFFNRDLLFERFNAFFWEAKIIYFLYYNKGFYDDGFSYSGSSPTAVTKCLYTFRDECRGLPVFWNNEKRQAEEISPFFKNFFKKNVGDILLVIAKSFSFLDNKTMSEWCERHRLDWPFSDVGDKEIEEYIRMFEWVQKHHDFPRLPDPLRTSEIEEFLNKKRIENKKQYDEFCLEEEEKRVFKELAQRESTSQKELDEETYSLSKSIEQTSEPKAGKYYEFLGIEKEGFKNATSIDYYLKNRKKSVLAADILESFSVLSHSELKRIYDLFVEEELEVSFFSLIGSQFYLFYDFYVNKGLWKNLEEKEYYLEKSLTEKVLEIAKKLEELKKKNKSFFVDIEGKTLTKDAIIIFTEYFFLERDSILESVGKKYIGEGRFEEEIKEASIYLLYLIALREGFSFFHLRSEPYVSFVREMLTSLRLFASVDLLDYLKTFSESLSGVENKDKLDHLLLISEKFVLKARKLLISEKFVLKDRKLTTVNDGTYKGEFHLLCSKKYFSLSFYSIRHLSDKQEEEYNYKKVWKNACDFLETYEKSFLEFSSLPSSSEKTDTSKTVVQDERGTFFKDKRGIISLILILVIVSLGLLGWWIYGKNKSKK